MPDPENAPDHGVKLLDANRAAEELVKFLEAGGRLTDEIAERLKDEALVQYA